MKMKSMKRDKKEKTKAEKGMPVDAVGSEDYPWGLNLRLEKESMDKLGIDIDDFIIGGKVELSCVAAVTNIQKSLSQTNDNSSVQLQITDLGVGKCQSKNPKNIKEAIKSLKEIKK